MAIDVEIAIASKLTTALSATISTRMHPLRFPDTPTFPCITYQEISAPVVGSHDETSATLTHARYQLDAWATTYSAAVSLGKAIFDALEGFKGVITKGSDTFTIMAILRVDKRTNNDSETGLFWVSQDFVIWY
jgi:hypothetical protein